MFVTEFPSYSISIYDDPDCLYKRQSLHDKQILSNVVSDEYYATNGPAFFDNYQNGATYKTMTYYVKVIVDKNIPEDTTVNTPSNVFHLSRTQIFNSVVTHNYILYLKEKDDKYTVYTTSFTIPKTDYIKTFDGDAYLNLVGEFEVDLTIPVNIAISNSAMTSLPQSTTAQVMKTISSKSSNLKYFKNYPVNFTRYLISDTFDYDFEQTTLTLSSNVFDTVRTIYQTNTSSGTMIRMDLDGESLLSSFDYYAFTFKNEDALYDPQTDSAFSLKINLDSGKTLTLDNWVLLENKTTGYYNVVFDLSLLSEVGFVNYIILAIATTDATITGKYSITYANFVNVNTGSVRIQSVMRALSLSEPVTHDVLGNPLAIEDLRNYSIVNSAGGFSVVQNSVEFKSDLNYLIETGEASVFLPDSSQILTKSGFKYVDAVATNDLVYYKSRYYPIQSIKVKMAQNYNIFEVYNRDEFDYKGFIIKLPIVLKNYKRAILPKNNISQTTDFIKIDGLKYFFKSETKTRFINDPIELSANTPHVIESEYPIKIQIMHSQTPTAQDIRVFAIDSGKSFGILDRNIKGKIKSTANLILNKILVIDET